MKDHKRFMTINTELEQTPISEQTSTFLVLYNVDFRYMFPWSQYDDNEEIIKNSNTQQTEVEESLLSKKSNTTILHETINDEF